MIESARSTDATKGRDPGFSERLRGYACFSSYVTSQVEPDSLDRMSAEHFIESVYEKCYGAQIVSHYPLLISVRDEGKKVIAAAGMRPALNNALFLEQYLDCPIEESVVSGVGERIARGSIVEIGNFAARNARAAICLMSAMAVSLDESGFSNVAVTATKKLRRTFTRLGLSFSEIAEARAGALPGNGSEWGSYYRQDPRVVFGPVAPAFSRLVDFLPLRGGPVASSATGQVLSSESEIAQ